MSYLVTGSNLPMTPMLHFIAALPAEAQSVGSLQNAAADMQSAPDKVAILPSLCSCESYGVIVCFDSCKLHGMQSQYFADVRGMCVPWALHSHKTGAAKHQW